MRLRILAIKTREDYYKVGTDNVEEITYDERGPFVWAGPAFRVAYRTIGDSDHLDVWIPLAAVMEVKALRPG